MVVDPNDADDKEAGHVGGVRRPFMRQRDRERLLQHVARWHMKVQHQQGHGDGEDAVAERLHPACLAHGHRVILIVHVELYTGPGWVSATPPRRRVTCGACYVAQRAARCCQSDRNDALVEAGDLLELTS